MENNFCKNILETFILINSAVAYSRKEIATKLGVNIRSVAKYISYLRDELDVDIAWSRKEKRYIVYDNGKFKDFIEELNISPMDIWFILIILLRSQYILPTKLKIIKKELTKNLDKTNKDIINKLFKIEYDNRCDESYHEHVLQKIYFSFIHGKKLKINYKKASTIFKNYKISPLNITFYNEKVYLLALNEECLIRTYRLDRIKNIIETDEEIDKRKFSMNEYLLKSWNMYGGNEVKIKLKVSNNAAKFIKEKNSIKKRILKETDEYTIFEITSYGTEGIKVYLLGLGEEFEVLEPQSLREEIKEIAQKICNNNA